MYYYRRIEEEEKNSLISFLGGSFLEILLASSSFSNDQK